MDKNNIEHVYLVVDDDNQMLDNFVPVTPGKPIRLLPFGKLVKNGVEREITVEIASQFKLPHYKPPIKLGKHAVDTPSGGSIIGLKVINTGDPSTDGLYADVELNKNGIDAIANGSFRYHSPEIIWEGEMEMPDGSTIVAPMIDGVALLHTPHLGESAALYQYNVKDPFQIDEDAGEDKNHNQEIDDMAELMLPKTLSDALEKVLGNKAPEDKPDGVTTEKYNTAVQERDDLQAKFDAQKADNEVAEAKANVVTEFNTDEYGVAFKAMGKDTAAVDVLASMTQYQRKWSLESLRKLSAQIDEAALLGETGSIKDGDTDSKTPVAIFNAAVEKISADQNVSYPDALKTAKTAHKDLFVAAYPPKKGGK